MESSVAEWFETASTPNLSVIKAGREIIMDFPEVSETVKHRRPAFQCSSMGQTCNA